MPRSLLSKKITWLLLIPVCAFLLFISRTSFEQKGDREGIFLLKGTTPFSLTITDDIFLGEQDRLLTGIELDPLRTLFSIPDSYATIDSTLSYHWSERNGRGYITNLYPNGTKLVTCFSRYLDLDGSAPSGLFVGGMLPFSVRQDGKNVPNASGMAFYNGLRWQHVWCSVNEAILTNGDRPANINPSRWNFLGSKILKATPKELVITSSHEVDADGTKLRIDRYALFKAGTTYFILINKIKNIGRTDAAYSYVYGDEPWVGNYGTSKGDVGWVEDRIINREEAVDTTKYNFAGMYDYGNNLIGEGQNFSRTSNFIEWLGNEKPGRVFFANLPGWYDEKNPKALSSDTRFIGLEWGPNKLAPDRSNTYIMAIGMAGSNPITGLPVKPQVSLDREEYITIMNRLF